MEAVVQEDSPQTDQLPEFDASFQDTAPTCYFHHVIDATAATLRVEVLGPNLAYTFRHERAKELRLTASNISKRLEAKVAGFLALRTGRNQKRVVLTWAQSGHGFGLRGDLLDPEPSVLPNDVWTKRAVNMGRALSLRMSRPYDGRVPGLRMEGVFQGSHVEVKLAVHAICILLSSFGITQDLDHVSPEHLTALRQAAWDDGSKPAFEIYFSRKNCHFCGKFVRRLQNATGITLKLVWRNRLVEKVYEKKSIVRPQANRPRPRDAIQIDADTVMTDEVLVIETIDLSGDQPVVPEIVNLTGDHRDNTSLDAPLPEQEPNGRARADAYIEGLAYCVGQIDECPASAQDAILAFASQHQQQQQQQQQRKVANPKNINKPLPATPQIAPPGYSTGVPTADAEPLGAAEAAIPNLLLMPPSSGGRQHIRANRGSTRTYRNNMQTLSQAPHAGVEDEVILSRNGKGLRIFTASAAPHPPSTGTRSTTSWIELPSRRGSSSPDPF